MSQKWIGRRNGTFCRYFTTQSQISTFKASVLQILNGLHLVFWCQMKAKMLVHIKLTMKSTSHCIERQQVNLNECFCPLTVISAQQKRH
jgi:hypothetical protein